MIRPEPKYPKEEFVRRGDDIFERDIKRRIAEEDPQKFVAIDIETGDFEVNSQEITAINQLRARCPEAQIFLRRVGSRSAHRIGGGFRGWTND